MSNVKMQGVDTIKFDDTYLDGGQKINLALGKDTRPMTVKFAFFFKIMLPFGISMMALLLAFFVKMYAPIFLLISLFSMMFWSHQRGKIMGASSGLLDEPKFIKYNKKASAVDISPKENVKKVEDAVPGIGEGVFFFGHELETHQEFHAADSKARTHIILFGTTGSGKTENILSICVNFLCMGSGFILIDGKGDTLLLAKTFSLCRAFNRCEDLYLMNFMDPGGRNVEKSITRLSHTFNFMTEASEAESNEIISGLMPNDDNAGMWEGRAASGIEGINQAAFYLKDNGFIELDPDVYREWFDLEAFVALAMNEDIPPKYRTGLWTILKSINYKAPTADDPNPKQNPTTEEQFQYITMQYTSTFNMLADSYSHITMSQVPDISITDIVLRRRILLVLLPSLAKSEQSVRNLGRIMIAITRNVSSKAIGAKVEGAIKTTIEGKVTAAINSYGLIFDEFGSYATKGAAMLPAQVRSLNMVCLFAGQDYEAFERGDEQEAATIFANCTIKICMKLESDTTFKKFQDSAGKKSVLVADTFEQGDNILSRSYKPKQEARIQEKDILQLPDMKALKAGQEVIIYGSVTHRLQAFYADPKMTAVARLNHFLEIRRPDKPTVNMVREGVNLLHSSMMDRINSDWERMEEAANSLISTYMSFNEALFDVLDQIKDVQKKKPELPRPSATEEINFAIGVCLRKVELVDYNTERSVNDMMGFESENEYDTSKLLDDDDALLKGFGFDLDEPLNSDHRAESEQINDSSDTDESSEGDAGGERDLKAVDESSFKAIEQVVEKKRQRLNSATEKSFDSLKAIQMNAFEVEESLRTLERAMLEKTGMDKTKAARLATVRSSSLLVDMGLKTNVAVVNESESKRKTPALSSKEIRQMTSRFIKE
tara:strand:- start:94517 stop:97177 length:2661 start_codon:yes stop_codon:yes gene_type:complete